MNDTSNTLTNGRAAAATLAAGIGTLALAIFTILGEATQVMGRLLNFYNPVGNLTGKTIMGVLVWLVSWAILNGRWKEREVNFGKVFTLALILVGLGFLGTFPPFFDLIAE